MTTEEYKKKIADLETATAEAREEKIRLEANLASSQERVQALEDKMKEKGYTPEELPTMIKELQAELDRLVVSIEDALPVKGAF